VELGAEGRVRLDEEVARAVSELGIPGLALAVTDRERTLAVATHGLANVDARTRVGPETLFQIGSVAKSFAALAALREVEEGRLDLGARLTEYLPWFRLRSGTEDVTLHGLLSHTSGLPPGLELVPICR
jgi:D-alanyl-D-alanine carboxypeptidase